MAPMRRATIAMHALVHTLPLPKDIVVSTPSAIAHCGHVRGNVLYEGRGGAQALCFMSGEDRSAELLRWLERRLRKFQAVRRERKGPRAFRGPVATACRLHSAYAY